MKHASSLTSFAFLVSALSIYATPTTAMQAPKEAYVEFAGRYSNVSYTEEHAYGYDLRLWRDGSSIFGLWSRTNGLPADFPAALVERLSWDEKTGSM